MTTYLTPKYTQNGFHQHMASNDSFGSPTAITVQENNKKILWTFNFYYLMTLTDQVFPSLIRRCVYIIQIEVSADGYKKWHATVVANTFCCYNIQFKTYKHKAVTNRSKILTLNMKSDYSLHENKGNIVSLKTLLLVFFIRMCL